MTRSREAESLQRRKTSDGVGQSVCQSSFSALDWMGPRCACRHPPWRLNTACVFCFFWGGSWSNGAHRKFNAFILTLLKPKKHDQEDEFPEDLTGRGDAFDGPWSRS